MIYLGYTWPESHKFIPSIYIHFIRFRLWSFSTVYPQPYVYFCLISVYLYDDVNLPYSLDSVQCFSRSQPCKNDLDKIARSRAGASTGSASRCMHLTAIAMLLKVSGEAFFSICDLVCSCLCIYNVKFTINCEAYAELNSKVYETCLNINLSIKQFSLTHIQTRCSYSNNILTFLCYLRCEISI